MQTVLLVSAIVLVTLGVIGCIVPLLPGPVIAYAGLLVLLCGKTAPTVPVLVGLGVACVVVLLMDTFLPPLVSRRFGGGKAGMWGSLAGSVVGALYFPIGIIVGAFLGALAFEKVFARKSWRESTTAGFGAFLGFLLGTALKLAYCVACLVIIWRG